MVDDGLSRSAAFFSLSVFGYEGVDGPGMGS